MSELIERPTIDSAASIRLAWAARARLLLFRLTAVVVEATLIGFVGKAILLGLHLIKSTGEITPPHVVALAYSIALVLMGATPAPPKFDQRVKPFVALAVTFAVCGIIGIDSQHHVFALIVWFSLSASAVVCARQMTQLAARTVAGAIQVRRSVAFVGNSDVAAEMMHEIRSHAQPVLEPIGFFDDRDGRPGPLNGLLPRLGTVDDLVEFIHERELDDVFVAMPWSASDRIRAVIERLRFLPLTVRLLPDHLPPSALPRREPDQFRGVVLPTLMVPPMSPMGRATKRAIDFAMAGLLLLALSPLFLILAMLIKLDSAGPVFFTQPRSGHFGRPFRIFKFRSLHVALLDNAAETLVSHGDQRVTRIGRFIRKYSIDEIPQILNVFLGDMSLVGPRPHAKRAKANGRVYADILEDYMLRYRVKPGMTGWAQVNGWRGNTDTEEKLRKRVEFDFNYISNWSILFDFRIMLLTFQSALFPPSDNA